MTLEQALAELQSPQPDRRERARRCLRLIGGPEPVAALISDKARAGGESLGQAPEPLDGAGNALLDHRAVMVSFRNPDKRHARLDSTNGEFGVFPLARVMEGQDNLLARDSG